MHADSAFVEMSSYETVALWYNDCAVSPKMRTPAAEPHLTKNYRLIYDLVREQGAGTHLSVAEVYQLAKARRPGIGATTVYRGLARLRDLGLVSEIDLPGAESAYFEPAGSAHAHFRCERCGKVEDIAYVLAPSVVEELARERGAEISEVSLTLQGRCAACKGRGA
jgi:Fe2+ or Zn2+ uptake regulation protein